MDDNPSLYMNGLCPSMVGLVLAGEGVERSEGFNGGRLDGLRSVWGGLRQGWRCLGMF